MKALAAIARRHIAAIEQNVALRREAVPDLGQQGLMLFEVVTIEDGGAQMQGALSTMGNDVEGVDVVSTLQRLGDLRQALAPGIQLDHLDVGSDTGDQALPVLDAGVHDDDLIIKGERFLGFIVIVAHGRAPDDVWLWLVDVNRRLSPSAGEIFW